MSLDPTTAQLLQRGFQARQAGRLDEARASLLQALARTPEQPDALYLLGDIAQARNDLPDSLAWMERAVRSQPAQALAWFRLGEVRESLGLAEAAADAYREAGQRDRALGVAHYNLARLLALQGRTEACQQALQAALALPSTPPPLRSLALQLRAQLQERAEDLSGALVSLDEALALTPERAALHHNRGVVLQRFSRHAEAIAAHDRALALGLDVADAHYNRGNSLQSLGRLQDALASYRTALARDGQHALALYDLARLRWRLGETGFDKELDAAAAQAQASAVALGIKARLLMRAERHPEAAAAFAEALAREPLDAAWHDGLGQALVQLGRHTDALAAHRRAIELAPERAAVHISHATSLLRAADAGPAAEAAERAVRLDPLDQLAWATLGTAWRALGHAGDPWLNDYAQHVQVYDLPPPPGFADMDSFNAALADELQRLHVDLQAPVDQTLRQGSQTLGNIFEQGHPLVSLLRQRITEAVDRYIAHLMALPSNDGHPLVGRAAPAWRYTDSWSSRLRRGGFHTHHVHPHGWISSCYYVAVPPTVVNTAAQAGWITFGVPDIAVPGLALHARRAVQPRPGRLVLFPSFMWHGTVPFEDDAPRLTVAFDVVPVS